MILRITMKLAIMREKALSLMKKMFKIGKIMVLIMFFVIELFPIISPGLLKYRHF